MLFELISNLFIMALLCGVNLMSPIGAKLLFQQCDMGFFLGFVVSTLASFAQ
jgi:hypothetical protein